MIPRSLADQKLFDWCRKVPCSRAVTAIKRGILIYSVNFEVLNGDKAVQVIGLNKASLA